LERIMVLRSVVYVWAAGLLGGTALAQTSSVLPYAPQETARTGEVRAFSPADFRPQQPSSGASVPVPAAVPAGVPQQIRAAQPTYGAAPVQPTAAPAYVPDYRPRPIDRQSDARPVQDFRPSAQGLQRPAPAVVPAAVEDKPRYPIYEAKPGVIDPRVIVPRKEEFIDTRGAAGPLDFRPHDYRPVDERALEYRSLNNRTPDQKVIDPRLKEKGPEMNVVLDCRAIQYRAVECNYLDYREVDPRLQELFARYPEVGFGIVPREYSKDTVERWQALLVHLSAQIGLKVTLKVANDYQALMEAQRAGQVHIAHYSPIAFARSRQAGIKLDTISVEANADGSKGSYSVLYSVSPRGQAPRQDDLRGKTLGLVDPNSVSGFFVPRMMLAAQRIDADTVLSKQIFTGSHENALMALSQGLVDVAVGQWVTDEDSTLGRMLAKGTLKFPDGTPMRREDFRVVMKSDIAMNGTVAMLSDMPDDLKQLIRRAVLEAPMRDRTAFDKIAESRIRWEPIDAKAYDSAVELVKFMDESRARAMAQPRQQAAR
jgi:phosphonate transport system substrate-binding protein